MSKLPSLLSEVRFGAYLIYSPRGTSQVSRLSRNWRDSIKFDLADGISRAVEQLSVDFAHSELEELFGKEVVLVPAPRSVPLLDGALWPARRIADELARHDLGSIVVPCIRREAPVAKSAFAAPGERPSPNQHLASLAAEQVLVEPARILVVDDVVTKGATLLAVSSLLKNRFPESDVATFAMIRTMGLQPEIERIVDPCVGTIRLTAGGYADRQP